MSAESSPPHQPNILRKPDKKPADFRATSQQQSNAGTYDDRGGDGRIKKILVAIAVVLIVALLATFLVDAIAGRDVL